MIISELIDESCVMCDLKVTSKKQLIQDMASRLVDSGVLDVDGISVRDIVSSSMEREKLGSTGVGSGVALPHARLEGLDRIYGVFARLHAAVDFDAVDDRPVDLAVLLVTPEDAGGAHLRALAMVSRRLRREDMRARLRSAPSAESLYLTLMESKKATAA